VSTLSKDKKRKEREPTGGAQYKLNMYIHMCTYR